MYGAIMRLSLFSSKQCMYNRIISIRNKTEWSPIRSVIISIKKFAIVIGSVRAYLSNNWRAIKWVSDYRCPIVKSASRFALVRF